MKHNDRRISIVCLACLICLLFTAGLLLPLFFAGCGGGSGTSGPGGGGSPQGGTTPSGKATLTITAPFPGAGHSIKSLVKTLLGMDKKGGKYIPPGVSLYVVKVCEYGTTYAVINPIQFNRPSGGGEVTTVTPPVPTGLKTVWAFAYGSQGTLLAQGSGDVDVIEETTNTVTVTLTPITTQPSITTTTPANGATGADPNTVVLAYFNVPMDIYSFDDQTFTLIGPGGKVQGEVGSDGSSAKIRPFSPLAFETTYTATVSGSVKSREGITMGSDYSWSFTTGKNPDVTPPTVDSTTPGQNAGEVPLNTTVSALFSEPMDSTTIDGTTFILETASGTVDATISASGNTATLIPKAPLSPGVIYKAIVKKDVKDLAGTTMTAEYAWTFTTATSPVVTSTTPASNAADVAVDTYVTAVFSKPVDGATITAASFYLDSPGGIVTSTVTTNGNTASLKPATSLSQGVTYKAAVKKTVKDIYGTPLAADYTWAFTTVSAPPPPPPSGGWSIQSSGTTATLRAVSVTGGSYYIAGGDLPSPFTNWILKYLGGAWTPQHSNDIGTMLTDCSFYTANEGYAVGYQTSADIYQTGDGGATWNKIFVSDAGMEWNAVYAAGYSSIIMVGTSGGTNGYEKHYKPGVGWTNLNAMSSRPVNSLIVRGTQAWAVGDTIAGNSMAYYCPNITVDSGSPNYWFTWSALNMSPNTKNLNAVFFTDTSNGWIVGQNGIILHTSTGGTTAAAWTTQASGVASYDLLGVYFYDTTHGWAVGTGGTILYTTDGGTTWLPQTSGTTWDLLDVKFTSTTMGWVVGKNGTILHTSSGGL